MRDIRFVRRQAILQGVLRQPDVQVDEIVEALREEVLELRARLAEVDADGPERPASGAGRTTGPRFARAASGQPSSV